MHTIVIYRATHSSRGQLDTLKQQVDNSFKTYTHQIANKLIKKHTTTANARFNWAAAAYAHVTHSSFHSLCVQLC